MGGLLGRVEDLARGQHGVVAVWQLRRGGWSAGQIKAGLRGMRRVHRGVCALGDLTERGWYMAAALAGGPDALISHASASMLLGLRPSRPGDIHVTMAGRGGRTHRDGIVPHRPRCRPAPWVCDGIPVTSPSQTLREADLAPHELYRALEEADRRRLPVDLDNEIVRLRHRVRGVTRSDTEAGFILLCHEHEFPLPLVNQRLNGFETDFHWPDRRLVVEVDGFEHHRERTNFNEDRLRGLVHRANGWEVVRISADHVYDRAALVLRALTSAVVPVRA